MLICPYNFDLNVLLAHPKEVKAIKMIYDPATKKETPSLRLNQSYKGK